MKAKMRLVASFGLVAIVLPWLGCATRPDPALPHQAGECTGSAAQAIYGGSPDPSSLGLDDVTAASVAAIVVESDTGPPSLCSGVLVAQRFVLTAAHCAVGATPEALQVSFGPSAAPFASTGQCAPPEPTYAAVALERDPDADVMLVELAADVSSVPALPIASISPVVGQAAVIAGYGLNQQGTAGEKRFVQTRVLGVGAGWAADSQLDAEADVDACAEEAGAETAPCSGGPILVTVDSGADAGACAGDSGGPLFVQGAEGWRVAGVLSEGSAYCTGEDVYVDLPFVATWIGKQVNP